MDYFYQSRLHYLYIFWELMASFCSLIFIIESLTIKKKKKKYHTVGSFQGNIDTTNTHFRGLGQAFQ
jgi:hypothetical protein